MFYIQLFPTFFMVQVFRVQVFQSSRFSGSGSRVRVQVLEVAGKKCKYLKNGNDFEYKIKSIFHYLSRVLRFTKKSVLNFEPNAQPVLLVQSQQSKHQNNAWNLFKVNNKDTNTMSMTLFQCFCYQLWFHCLLWYFSLNNILPVVCSNYFCEIFTRSQP